MTEPGTPAVRRTLAWRRARGPRQVPWLLVVPGLAALVVFHFVAIGFGSYYAFTKWNGLTTATWVGLRNFREIFADPTATRALWNTLELAGAFLVLVNVVGLALAIGLNRALKTRHVLRALFFAPVALSPLAVAYIWQYIFTYDGALNLLLGDLGLGSLQRDWLGSPSFALWTILVVMVWQYAGLSMVIYLAGLQAIGDEIYEAALVDGASGWLRFRRVILPLLAPAMTISTILSLVFGLRVFDQVIALTGGGPVDASETLALEVYQQTFTNGAFGYGAAFALVLTALITVLAITQLVILRFNEKRI